MTDDVPQTVERAFERADAFESTPEGFRATTTAFEGRVTVADATDDEVVYALTVRAPTLDAATTDEIGEAVHDGWFETLELRLADAPKATRSAVELDEYGVELRGDEVVVHYRFAMADPVGAAAVAKTFVEYVEGTYVEGVVPGYDYEPPVADLVARAYTASDEGGAGGTPL